MPNNPIQDEIKRLARREINAAIKGLKKDNARLKREAADLKRRVAKLEKSLSVSRETLAKFAKKSLPTAVPGKARFRIDTVASLRKRLKLSQKDFAQLVGASLPSVHLWEHGTEPREAMKLKILGLRKLTAKQVREIVDSEK